jgi:quercetin dioxygenase-like cupin family protein
MGIMRSKIKVLALALSVAGVFAAGVAVGKVTRSARYIAREEVKFVDQNGLKLGVLTGDKDKGPHTTLVQLAGGFESPWHSHSGDYEAIQIAGTSRHWGRGESGAKAKKMTPGSYWMIPGGVDHISACDRGADCLLVIWQKTRFDAAPGKDVKPAARTARPAARPAAKTP